MWIQPYYPDFDVLEAPRLGTALITPRVEGLVVPPLEPSYHPPPITGDPITREPHSVPEGSTFITLGMMLVGLWAVRKLRRECVAR